MEQIGDTRALAPLVKIVNARYRRREQLAVQEAARHCLEALHARLDGTGETLLRSSQAHAAPDDLLRAAGAIDKANAETLLRSAHNA